MKREFRFSRDVENNCNQKIAVSHIVCGTSRPAPYLIYGPPGTGKTTTVVEAIEQVGLKGFPSHKNYETSLLIAVPVTHMSSK